MTLCIIVLLVLLVVLHKNTRHAAHIQHRDWLWMVLRSGDLPYPSPQGRLVTSSSKAEVCCLGGGGWSLCCLLLFRRMTLHSTHQPRTHQSTNKIPMHHPPQNLRSYTCAGWYSAQHLPPPCGPSKHQGNTNSWQQSGKHFPSCFSKSLLVGEFICD